MDTRCNICSAESIKIFDALILEKYPTNYYQCSSCSFIQTGKPFWLNEAYTSAITSIDVGLVYRNVEMSGIVPSILDVFSTADDSYIDYGGGYGLFVRMMRDKGYDFYLLDKYADNLFAKYFDVASYNKDLKFASLTSFEVFEHLENPLEELDKMFALSDTIIFSTELQPASSFSKSSDWWYFMPETGQHISFYSKASLEYISKTLNCAFYTNERNLHILSRRLLKTDPFAVTPEKQKTVLSRIAEKLAIKPLVNADKRESLLLKDFELYKKKVFLK